MSVQQTFANRALRSLIESSIGSLRFETLPVRFIAPVSWTDLGLDGLTLVTVTVYGLLTVNNHEFLLYL